MGILPILRADMILRASMTGAVGGRVIGSRVMMSLTCIASRSIEEVRLTSASVTMPTRVSRSITGKPRCLLVYIMLITWLSGRVGGTVVTWELIMEPTVTSCRRWLYLTALDSMFAPM